MSRLRVEANRAKAMRYRIFAAALLLSLAVGIARADVTQAEPRVLAVITNGAGGFRYATLAELLYDQKLTEEPLARAHLPRIRKRELIAAGAILGVHDYFFFDQKDGGYTRDSGEALEQWNLPSVRCRLTEVLTRGDYGFVLLLLPTATTHGAHQAADRTTRVSPDNR